jgi:2-succinyl-6-hydroxy-2,4-cyclohexadiene-1-carboxylate synthase
MRVTVDDGVGLEVRRVGAGPPFVMVHGFGGAKEDFADHAEQLGRHATVVTFDHRGHGESDKPGDPAAYSLDRLAADTVQVAQALGFERFRLLGHSMGGMVVRRLVLSEPERVDALVLMDTASGPPEGMDASMVDLAAGIALDDGMAELKRVRDVYDPLGTPAHQRLLVQRPGYGEYCDAVWFSLSAVMWATLAPEIVRQADELDRMRGIRCPTLVIVGEQDQPFLAPSRAMADAIPDARLVVISDAGHSPQFENPSEWFAAVDEFVRLHDHAPA